MINQVDSIELEAHKLNAALGEKILLAQISLVEHLPRSLTAHRIHPQMNADLISRGIDITRACFPGDTLAAKSCADNYARIMAGKAVLFEPAETIETSARFFEATCYFIYLEGLQAVGIGGIYRYLDEPNRYWMGRLAITPLHQKTGLGEILINHLYSCVKRLGGNTIDAFTEQDSHNAAVQQFYEKRGFVQWGPQIVEFEKVQRVYRKTL